MTKRGYRLEWETLKQDWPLWVIMIGLLVAAFCFYPHLPEQVPSHWNLKGEIDSYTSRTWGAFLMPLLVPALYLMMILLPVIDPRRDNYVRFQDAYRLMRWSLILFLGGLYVLTMLFSLGYNINVSLIVKAGVSLLLTVIGNFMGQFRHNYFVGIKTPWTLASEEVWHQTHRLGGRVWVLGGLVCLAMSPINYPWANYLYFVSIMVMALLPMVYSYLLYRRIAA
ncbi:MAG: SdpI family protein [Bacillota bacterium]